MNLKYMKVSLFEISYKKKLKKILFFTIFIFLDVPVYELSSLQLILDPVDTYESVISCEVLVKNLVLS